MQDGKGLGVGLVSRVLTMRQAPPKSFMWINSFHPPNTLRCRFCHYPHFTGEDAQGGLIALVAQQERAGT